MFVNLLILLILVAIPWENPESWCWIYSNKSFYNSNHLPIFWYFHHQILPVSLHMPRLPGSNGCQSYLVEYSCWDNLILLLQISNENSYPYPWHCPYQHFPNMHTKLLFYRMCAPEYLRLVLSVPSLDMQIFVFPMLHGAHTLPWTSFSVYWYVISLPLLPKAPVCLHSWVEGKGKHKSCTVWKTWRHSPKIIEFLVVGPVALVQYIPQRAKVNKMQ